MLYLRSRPLAALGFAVVIALFITVAAHAAPIGINTAIMADRTGTTMRFRPYSAPDHLANLSLSNYAVHGQRDIKAVHITASDTGHTDAQGRYWTYNSITLKNFDVYDVYRTAAGAAQGLHMDAFKIEGSQTAAIKTTLLMQDIWVHSTNAESILIKDGYFGSVTLRNINLGPDNLQDLKIYGTNQFPIGNVLIENSPGLRVMIQGQAGTVGKVTVRNSPGAYVRNVPDINGYNPYAAIVYETSAPVPEPTAAAILIMTAVPLLRRRRCNQFPANEPRRK